MGDDKLFDAVTEVFLALSELGLTTRERLRVLELAWLFVASQERAESLAFPGGFPAAQAQQVQLLERMAMFIKADTPDLERERVFQEDLGEGERLFQDGKVDETREHLRRLRETYERELREIYETYKGDGRNEPEGTP